MALSRSSFPATHESVDLECGVTASHHVSSRRQDELDLILSLDSQELRRHEAWFLVETKWLDAWMSYVLGDDNDGVIARKQPGPLTNETLFDYEKFCIKSNLQQTKDYRGVNSQVYALYAELYGTNDTRPIVRWTLDIYAVPVMVDDVKDMLHVPRLKARALVLELNERREMMDKGLINGLKKHEEKESWGYRCLCRCEFLVPCLYRMLGGGPTYEKEKQIKWSDYLYCCEKTNKKKKKRRRGEKTRAIINDYAEEDRRSTESSTSSDEETHELLG